MVKGLILVTAICVVGGCVELGLVLQDGAGGPLDSIDPPDRNGNGGQPDNGTLTGRLAVSLTVSNASPQVNEEVFVTCAVVDGDPAGAVFAFQSSAGRLTVDSDRGRATFVVDASDVNTELAFTCTATNDGGTSAPSNRVVIIPTG